MIFLLLHVYVLIIFYVIHFMFILNIIILQLLDMDLVYGENLVQIQLILWHLDGCFHSFHAGIY